MEKNYWEAYNFLLASYRNIVDAMLVDCLLCTLLCCNRWQHKRYSVDCMPFHPLYLILAVNFCLFISQWLFFWSDSLILLNRFLLLMNSLLMVLLLPGYISNISSTCHWVLGRLAKNSSLYHASRICCHQHGFSSFSSHIASCYDGLWLMIWTYHLWFQWLSSC